MKYIKRTYSNKNNGILYELLHYYNNRFILTLLFTNVHNMYLTIDQVEQILSENLYEIEDTVLKSRPFSGFYDNKPSLPPLSLPGGDLGQLAMLYSAAFTYGFEVDFDKAGSLLIELVGGKNALTYKDGMSHTLEAYRYLSFLNKAPESYNMDEIGKSDFFTQVEKMGIHIPDIADGKLQNENAYVILHGELGLYPTYDIKQDSGYRTAHLLIFQQTLANRRLKRYVELLLEKSVIKLYEGLDADYLYEVLAETQDVHIYETLARIDKKMPVFSASLLPSGKIHLEQYS